MYGTSSGKNNGKNCREKLFHTNKYNCMFLNVGIGVPVFEVYGNIFR